MTIYRTLLQEQFDRLHPKLQHRYALDAPFYAEGTMSRIQNGSRLLKPFLRVAAGGEDQV